MRLTSTATGTEDGEGGSETTMLPSATGTDTDTGGGRADTLSYRVARAIIKLCVNNENCRYAIGNDSNFLGRENWFYARPVDSESPFELQQNLIWLQSEVVDLVKNIANLD